MLIFRPFDSTSLTCFNQQILNIIEGKHLIQISHTSRNLEFFLCSAISISVRYSSSYYIRSAVASTPLYPTGRISTTQGPSSQRPHIYYRPNTYSSAKWVHEQENYFKLQTKFSFLLLLLLRLFECKKQSYNHLTSIVSIIIFTANNNHSHCFDQHTSPLIVGFYSSYYASFFKPDHHRTIILIFD
jgi:hypothetical protein